MTWNDAGQPAPYSAWPRGMAPRLWAIYDDLRAGRPGPVADPPPNAWQVRAGDDPSAIHTAFRADVAREMYLTAMAHSLLIDVERRVPWTLGDLNGDELDALLSSASMFWWNQDQQAYEVSEFDHGWAVPASPVTAWRFLQEQRLLKATRLDTVTAVVAWARGLTHFAGPVSRENFAEHWGYEGDMPVARALAGTRYSGVAFRSLPGFDQVRHYTAGCHGTVGLLLSVLRAANIPTRPRSVSNDTFTHATMLFLSEDLALSHGDDPYSQMAEGAEPADLLIDAATYDRWLGPLATDPGRNIGRQALTIGVQQLPAIVRRAHALDRQQGIAPEQSAVFAMFRGTFTMEELVTAGLWERLDAAVASNAPAAAAADAARDVWMEAEDLKAEVTAGVVERQAMDDFTTARGGTAGNCGGARPGRARPSPFPSRCRRKERIASRSGSPVHRTTASSRFGSTIARRRSIASVSTHRWCWRPIPWGWASTSSRRARTGCASRSSAHTLTPSRRSWSGSTRCGSNGCADATESAPLQASATNRRSR